MNEQTTRILLTLDCDSIDLDIMRALSIFAEEHPVELTGLYVEDEDLIKAAKLPGLLEISLTSGAVSKLSAATVSSQTRSQLEKVRTQFEKSARSIDYKTLFRVVRGRVIEMFCEAARNSDLIVVSRALRPTGMRTYHGSQFGNLLSQHSNFLFVNEPWHSGNCIIALYEFTSNQHDRALHAARRFADREQIELIVAVPQKEISRLPVSADKVVTLRNWSEETIVQLCAQKDARLLVLPPSDHLDWRKLLMNLIDRLSCSLLRLEN